MQRLNYLVGRALSKMLLIAPHVLLVFRFPSAAASGGLLSHLAVK